MIKLGPASGEMRTMSDDDIFSSRVKLLIIMSKAFLKGCPLGNYRKQAIKENANYVFYHSLQLVSEYSTWKDNSLDAQKDIISKEQTAVEHVFHQKIRLLAVMAKALAEDRLVGHFRQKALNDNLNQICEALIFNFQIKDASFLKVA